MCVARLACVPNLRLDGILVDGQCPGRKFYTDGRLAVKIEFVTCEPRQDCAEETFRAYGIFSHESLLDVRFLFAGLYPRQYGQIIHKFRDIVRTISRRQSHQSERPVRGSRSVSPFLRFPRHNRRTLKRKSKLLPSVMGTVVVRKKVGQR